MNHPQSQTTVAKTQTSRDPKQRILEAARREFAAKGFYGSRMQNIADQAGCNKAMLHYYFGSKEKLYYHLLGQIFSALFHNLQQSLMVDDSGRWWMKVVEAYLDYFSRNRDLIPLMLRELADDAPRLRKVLNELTISIGKGQDTVTVPQAFRWRMEHLPFGDLDPVHTIMSLVGLAMVGFFGKPLFEVLSGHEVGDFQAYLDQRRRNIAALLEGRLGRPGGHREAGS